MPVEPGSVLFIQFARSPVEGKVKTRMIPALGARGACQLHCDLVRWTSRILVNAGLGPVQLAVAGNTLHPLVQQCRDMGIAEVVPQSGTGLGERMFTALDEALERFERVILVGSDCPGLDDAYLSRAVDSLQQASVVLGPAEDGGYVLIGARQVSREMFAAIDWGSSQVYAQTLARLQDIGCDWLSLPAQVDIDRPEDIVHWESLRDSTV